MQLEEIQGIKKEINNKIRSGDFIILSEILGISCMNANQRYRRNKPKEVIIMQDIVTERELLINKLKNKHNEKLD